MLRTLRMAVAAVIATFTVQPAMAQHNQPADVAAELGIEPLTAEQEALLPQARRVVLLVMPEGSAGRMMGGIGNGWMSGIALSERADATSALSETLGYAYYNADLNEGKAERALNILNPSWRERQETEARFIQDMVNQVWAPLAPVLREAMAELYAINFTAAQLEDIEAFYATETGQAFAAGSLQMANDPRLFAAMMQASELFENFTEPDMGAMEEALAALPRMRTYDELSEREHGLVGALLGLDQTELRETMNAAQLDSGLIEATEAAEAAVEAAGD